MSMKLKELHAYKLGFRAFPNREFGFYQYFVHNCSVVSDSLQPHVL